MAEPDNTLTTPAPATRKKYRARTRPNSPRLTVFCSEEAIQNAVRRDSLHCWISEAIQAAVPEIRAVTVDLQAIRFSDPVKRLHYVYLSPPEVCQAIIDFDQEIVPKPFTFTLRTAAHITRSGRPKGSKNGHRKTRAERTEYMNEHRKIRTQVYATADEPFEPPKQHRERVVAAMDDPGVNLGPAMVFAPPNGNKSSVPVVVGGNPPRRGPNRGNLARTRRFGLRQLRE